MHPSSTPSLRDQFWRFTTRPEPWLPLVFVASFSMPAWRIDQEILPGWQCAALCSMFVRDGWQGWPSLYYPAFDLANIAFFPLWWSAPRSKRWQWGLFAASLLATLQAFSILLPWFRHEQIHLPPQIGYWVWVLCFGVVALKNGKLLRDTAKIS